MLSVMLCNVVSGQAVKKLKAESLNRRNVSLSGRENPTFDKLQNLVLKNGERTVGASLRGRPYSRWVQLKGSGGYLQPIQESLPNRGAPTK